ncbi:MAG: SRPBCC domain-containing protein [Chloroflexi bacterium]|nr:SRPBCC domain-containing protein [Chloroflexota bacterium]
MDFHPHTTARAPCELVFQAWTDPEHLQWFFGDVAPPREPIELDLRVGGVWKQQMIVNESTEYFTGGVYREIVPGEKLVFVWGAFDGWPEISPGRLDDGPVVTVTLNEVGDETEMVVNLRLPDHLSEDRVREWLASGMREGWGQTLDRLVARFAGVGTRN